MWNVYTSAFPNTSEWEQQEWNKTKKQNKKVREEWVLKEIKQAQKKNPTEKLQLGPTISPGLLRPEAVTYTNNPSTTLWGVLHINRICQIQRFIEQPVIINIVVKCMLKFNILDKTMIKSMG